MVTKKYVIVESSGKLNILGGIQGPILTPSYLDTKLIVALINAGKVVYEVNPKNRSEKVRLTRLNIYTENFMPKQDTVTPIVETKVMDVKPSNIKVIETPIEVEPEIEEIDEEYVEEDEEVLDDEPIVEAIGIDSFVSNKKS